MKKSAKYIIVSLIFIILIAAGIFYYLGYMHHIFNINTANVKEVTIVSQPPGDFKVIKKASDISRIVNCINSLRGRKVDSKKILGRTYRISISGKKSYSFSLVSGYVVFDDSWYCVNSREVNDFEALMKSLKGSRIHFKLK